MAHHTPGALTGRMYGLLAPHHTPDTHFVGGANVWKGLHLPRAPQAVRDGAGEPSSPAVSPEAPALPLTGEGVDVDDSMLPGLVVDDDVDPEERDAQRLPQGPGELPDDLITWPREHALDLVQLSIHTGVRP